MYGSETIVHILSSSSIVGENTNINSVSPRFFVAVVLWVGYLAMLGGSGGMPSWKKILKNNPLNGYFWWDFLGKILTKLIFYVNVQLFLWYSS